MEILLFFNWWFLAAYLLISIVLMIYKGNKLYYPDDTLVWDVVILGLYMLNEAVRLSFSSKGNKTENFVPLAKGLILGPLAIVVFVYFLQLQTWVLHIEVILNSIGLGFVGLEMLLSLYSFLLFWREGAIV